MKKIQRPTALVMSVLVFSSGSLFAYPSAPRVPLPAPTLQRTSMVRSTSTTRSRVQFPRHDSHRLVIHIHDIHRDMRAQLHIAKIIRERTAQRPVDQIAVEGAHGAINIDTFRREAPRALLVDIATFLFKRKEMSGVLWAALINPTDLPPLVGIDDPQHYRQNIAAYRAAQIYTESAQRQWKNLHHRWVTQKIHRLNPALRKFHGVVEKYRAGDLSVDAYVRYLAAWTADKDTPVAVRRFLEIFCPETKETQAEIAREQSQFAHDLSLKLSPTNAERAIAAIGANTNMLVGAGSRFTQIQEFCLQTGLKLDNYPTLSAHLHRADHFDKLELEKVVGWILPSEAKIYHALTTNADEKNYVSTATELYLISKLLNFALSSKEWTWYLRRHRSSRFDRSLHLAAFEQFYREAQARDIAMANNLLQDLPATTILVTGGFHADGIDEKLLNAGCTVETIIPSAPGIKTDNGSAYLQAFSARKTALEQLIAGPQYFLAQPVAPENLRTQLAMLISALVPEPSKMFGKLMKNSAITLQVIHRNTTNVLVALKKGPNVLLQNIRLRNGRVVDTNTQRLENVQKLLEEIRNASNINQIYKLAMELGELEGLNFLDQLRQIEELPGYLKGGTTKEQQILAHAKTFFALFHAPIHPNGVPEGVIQQPTKPDQKQRASILGQFPKERLDKARKYIQDLFSEQGEAPVASLNDLETVRQFNEMTGIDFDVYGAFEYYGITPKGTIEETVTGSFKRRQFIEKIVRGAVTYAENTWTQFRRILSRLRSPWESSSGSRLSMQNDAESFARELIRERYLYAVDKEEPGKPLTLMINSSGNAIQGLLHTVQILVERGIYVDGQLYKLPQKSNVVMVAHKTLSPTKQKMVKDKFGDYAGDIQFTNDFIPEGREYGMFLDSTIEETEDHLQDINFLLSSLDTYVDRWNSANRDKNERKLHVRASNEESALMGGASILENARQQLKNRYGVDHVDYIAMGRGGGGPVGGMGLGAKYHKDATGDHTTVLAVGSDIPTVSLADGQAIQNAQSWMQLVLLALPEYLHSSNVNEAFFYKATADLHRLEEVSYPGTDKKLTTKVEVSAASALAKLYAIMADPNQWDMLRPGPDGRKRVYVCVLSGKNLSGDVSKLALSVSDEQEMGGINYLVARALHAEIKKTPSYPRLNSAEIEGAITSAVDHYRAKIATEFTPNLDLVRKWIHDDQIFEDRMEEIKKAQPAATGWVNLAAAVGALAVAGWDWQLAFILVGSWLLHELSHAIFISPQEKKHIQILDGGFLTAGIGFSNAPGWPGIVTSAALAFVCLVALPIAPLTWWPYLQFALGVNVIFSLSRSDWRTHEWTMAIERISRLAPQTNVTLWAPTHKDPLQIIADIASLRFENETSERWAKEVGLSPTTQRAEIRAFKLFAVDLEKAQVTSLRSIIELLEMRHHRLLDPYAQHLQTTKPTDHHEKMRQVAKNTGRMVSENRAMTGAELSLYVRVWIYAHALQLARNGGKQSEAAELAAALAGLSKELDAGPALVYFPTENRVVDVASLSSEAMTPQDSEDELVHNSAPILDYSLPDFLYLQEHAQGVQDDHTPFNHNLILPLEGGSEHKLATDVLTVKTLVGRLATGRFIYVIADANTKRALAQKLAAQIPSVVDRVQFHDTTASLLDEGQLQTTLFTRAIQQIQGIDPTSCVLVLPEAPNRALRNHTTPTMGDMHYIVVGDPYEIGLRQSAIQGWRLAGGQV